MFKPRGFTLIELLIVLVLIAVITGMAMLSMGIADPRDQQKLESERLLKLLELATQEAIVRSEMIGVEFSKQGYRFVSLNQQKWQVEESDIIFKPREIKPILTLALTKNTSRIDLPLLSNFNLKPQIIISPAGDIEPFELSVALQNSKSIFWVSNTADNGLVLKSEDPR